jgi:protein gp37
LLNWNNSGNSFQQLHSESQLCKARLTRRSRIGARALRLIAGGESGPGHRPCDPAWVRELRDRCIESGTAFFFKQWGGRTPKTGGRLLDGRTWDDYPQLSPVSL